MAAIHLPISDEALNWVQTQSKQRNFDSIDDYIMDLIDQDRDKRRFYVVDDKVKTTRHQPKADDAFEDEFSTGLAKALDRLLET